jgi:hypothetical protein
MEPILLPIGEVDGLIEYLKRNPIRIGQGFVQKRAKFRFNYYQPGYGGFSSPSIRTGRGSFSPLFPTDLHKIGDIAPLEYQINAFKYGFYHSIIDQGLRVLRYNDPMPFFLDLFDRSPILHTLGALYIQLKIQEEKTRVGSVFLDRLYQILVFLINIILVVYSFGGELVERDDRIITQKFYTRQTIQFEKEEQHYDPVLYSIAVVQSDVSGAFSFTNSPRSAAYLWDDESYKIIGEWVHNLWYFLIKMYDLKNFVFVLNAILFSKNIVQLQR